MKITVFISCIVIFFVAAYFGISVFIAHTLTTPGDSPILFDKKLIGDRVADVAFRSNDNIQLAGWYFRGTNDKAILFVHGAGGENRANEIYGTPEIAKYFYDKGYSLLMFDLRGMGDSQKTRISLGQHEANDVIGAYNYLIAQDFKPGSIGIISNSLGAISTIMGSASLKNVGAIVLDSPAAEIKEITSNIMKNEHNIPEFMHSGTFLSAKLFYKVDIDKIRPIDRIEEFDATPLLFLHGESDSLIPPHHSQLLFEKAGNAQRITFPNTKHVETYISNKTEYLELVDNFFEENLDPSP